MPELPDVEVYRRRLEASGLRRRISRVRLLDDTLLRDASRQRLTAALHGHCLVAASRHGKHLFAATSDDGPTLVMHFGMTGVLLVDDEQERYARLVLEYDDGGRLVLQDPRRLGFVSVTDDVAAYTDQHRLGPDALALSTADLRRLLRGHRGGVKALLMDQSRIAGVGNIYSDEVLFHARIDPRRRADSLDDAETRRLHRQLRRVLLMAADRGADVARFPDGWLLPHRSPGVTCPRGDGEITKVQLVGRGAYFCPACQR